MGSNIINFILGLISWNATHYRDDFRHSHSHVKCIQTVEFNEL